MSQHEKPIYITVTGGPGAGKTSVMNIIGARLRDLGMLVQVADDNGKTLVDAAMLQGEIVLSPNSPIFITTSDRSTVETPV